jgi:hypothetical protein
MFSVDIFIQASIYGVYRGSKVCGHVDMRGLDNVVKPVD